MQINNLGTFTYPANVLISYHSDNPNLSVKLFLIREIKKVNDIIIDNLDNNVYSSNGLVAEQIDGSSYKYTEPIIIPRQKNFDLGHRGVNTTYVYSKFLENLKAGDYFYKIEIRYPDELIKENGKNVKKIGTLIDQVYGTFKIEYSPIDRLFCVGQNFSGENVYLTIAQMIEAIYKSASTNWVYASNVDNSGDLVVVTPYLDIGTRIKITPIKLEGEQNNLGISIENVVGNLENGNRGAVFKNLQYGEYTLQAKGVNTIYKINHKKFYAQNE